MSVVGSSTFVHPRPTPETTTSAVPTQLFLIVKEQTAIPCGGSGPYVAGPGRTLV